MLPDRISDGWSRVRESRIVGYFIAFVYALRRSLFLSLFVLGIVIFVLGATMVEGILSGMMGIWGGTLILIGGGVFGGMWVIRYVIRDRRRNPDGDVATEHGGA